MPMRSSTTPRDRVETASVHEVALGQKLPRVTTPPPGPRSRALAGRLSAVESPSFAARRAARGELSGVDQGPIVYVRAEGCNVEDADGNVYVDLVAGFGA